VSARQAHLAKIERHPTQRADTSRHVGDISS
jgi:hypothetical protein